ncbi:MAG: carboxypeptidase-like regulatory domain-containing protein [Candidatus Sulfotelmatobacter sp.]
MIACSISIRWLAAMMALCLFGAQAWAATQVADAPPTIISGGAYRIAGTVLSNADGHPLGGARITIRDAKNQQKFQSVVTSDDGKFEFNGLPPGKYSQAGAKRGFITASYDQHDQFSTAIVTGAGLDTETLILRLAPNAVITGKVLDEVGEPVRHATVMLYYDDHSGGGDRIRQSRGTQTNDQGTYEITPLQPGTYFLSADASPWYAVYPNLQPGESESQGQVNNVDRSLDVAYPVTFYADVTDADSATPIPIRGGDHLQVDIHLNPVPALRLLFHMPDNGNNGFIVPQLQQPAFDGSTSVQHSGAREVSPGLVEITGVPAGRYNVRIPSGENWQQLNGVDFSKDGEQIDTSNAEALGRVKVSVQVTGEATLPRLAVGLRSGNRMRTELQIVDPKGETDFWQLTPGSYEIVVRGSAMRYSIAHMVAEGGQVSGHTLTVAAGSSASVSLTLVGGNVEVEGTVQKAGKGFSGAMVVLVPKDPEMNRDLFRRDQSDLDGTFSLHGVVPGAYTLLAIENGWDLDWSQPGIIAAYLKHGRKIQVSSQPGRSMNIVDPIELQSK